MRACALDESGQYLVSGGKDATVRCYNVLSGKLMWHYDGHTDYLNRILIDQGRVFSAGRDSTIRSWDVKTGRLLNVFASSAVQADTRVGTLSS